MHNQDTYLRKEESQEDLLRRNLMPLKIKKEWQEKIDIGLKIGIRAFLAIIIFVLVINSTINLITDGPPWVQWEKNKIALLQKHPDATLVCGKEDAVVSGWELWKVDQVFTGASPPASAVGISR